MKRTSATLTRMKRTRAIIALVLLFACVAFAGADPASTYDVWLNIGQDQ